MRAARIDARPRLGGRRVVALRRDLDELRRRVLLDPLARAAARAGLLRARPAPARSTGLATGLLASERVGLGLRRHLDGRGTVARNRSATKLDAGFSRGNDLDRSTVAAAPS